MLMQPVKIRIQSQSSSIDGTDSIETVTIGRMTEKNNKFYAFYEEPEEVDQWKEKLIPKVGLRQGHYSAQRYCGLPAGICHGAG